jgi:predicted nuclease of predicted toxin-antitoxin system
MKFLLDQSAERRLAAYLRNLGHDVKIVAVDYPPGILDKEVLAHAYKESRIVLTNDKGDFGAHIFRDLQPHSGVVLFRRFRAGDLTTKQERLSYVLRGYAGQLQNFVVVTPKTYRSLILETCSEIWKFSLQRDNDVEV